MSFPKTLFVRADKLANGGVDYFAYEHAAEAVDDDGPTVVATYKLVVSNSLRKAVVTTKRK